MEHDNEARLNPWFSMWIKPRATIQQIVDTDPERHILLLAGIFGISQMLGRASASNMGDEASLTTLLIVVFFVGPVFVGWIGLYFFGAVLRWTGGWLKGRASPNSIRAAIAWSRVPSIWALVIWIPKLIIFGQESFTSAKPNISTDSGFAIGYIGFWIIETIVLVWGIVIFLKSLAQVQGFSAWKGLATALLAVLIPLVPIAIISFLFMSAN
ncbi:MAG: Yip1 family protein [Planctomycetota bacterium]|jgi:hypothetical protein